MSTPRLLLEEFQTPVERTLTASASDEHKAMIETLRSNIGTIVERWAAASARTTYMRGTDLKTSDEDREDRMRVFLEALLARTINQGDKMALEALKTAIRSEQSRALSLSMMIRRQSLLRDVMYDLLVQQMSTVPKTTIKLAVDAIVDRSIEGTVVLIEEYAELQSSLSRWMLSAAIDDIAVDRSLSRFCLDLMGYLDAEFVALFRTEAGSDNLIVQASAAKGLALTKGESIQMKAFPLVRDAISQKRSLASGDVRTKTKKKTPGRITFTYTVAVPILRGESVSGVLFIGDNLRPGLYTADEISLLDDLSKQLGRMLDNTELFDKLMIRAKAQKVLIDTAALLQKEIESEEIYRIVATTLDELLPSDEFVFYVYDWARRVGNPVYSTGPYAAETMADRDFPADSGIAGYVARTGKAEIIVDTETDPRGSSIPGTPALHSRMLAVPVIGKKDVIGVIELLRYPPENFSEEDLEIAKLFANHASVALENSKLLGEVMRTRDQLEVSIDMMTHDIANYTTPINAYFSDLRKIKGLKPEVAAAVEKTSRQIESIVTLVEMVRTMTKVRETTSRTLAPVDLRKAIDDAVSETKGRACGKDIDFEMFFPAEGMKVLADDLLKDLFTSMFFSAAMSDKHNETKFTVTAETRKDNRLEYWLVKVAQPDRAIPDNLKSEVLKIAKASRSELGGGFGIGLATARDIVSRYAGGMWVSDIAPGDSSKGCVFNIALPKAR